MWSVLRLGSAKPHMAIDTTTGQLSSLESRTCSTQDDFPKRIWTTSPQIAHADQEGGCRLDANMDGSQSRASLRTSH